MKLVNRWTSREPYQIDEDVSDTKSPDPSVGRRESRSMVEPGTQDHDQAAVYRIPDSNESILFDSAW